MAESIVTSVAKTIETVLIDEAKFLWGVEGKVEDLHRELRLIRCLLRDADAKREHNQAVGECVAQLREFAYDAEDIIERYILTVTVNNGQNIIKAYACFAGKCTCLQVHVVGTKIEGLKSSISNLRTSLLAFGAQPVNESEGKGKRASTLNRTYAHFEEDFVGREDSLKVLVEKLKDENQERVIFVWGMGGVGKTTLAKKVFNHDEVKNHFDAFAWACISQEYQERDILEGILLQLKRKPDERPKPDEREKITKMRVDELSVDLYNTQKQERCLVVLDDIWTKEAWDSIRAAFPIKDLRSKLLITTRNKEVAEHISPEGFFHEPRCLSEEESWDLLKKRAFPKRKDVELSLGGPQVGQGIVRGLAIEGSERQSELEGQMLEITGEMKKLGDKLLEKCGGLPLAIILVGGLLAVNDWEMVCKKINLHLGDKSDVSKVLALSYDDLPRHLKPCFLYLGSFPEDAEILATKVLHMWIAEGFVSLSASEEAKEIQVEVVAEQYLMELVNRGMVQVRFNQSGKIKTCDLHDLMRDLCISKATQEGFLSTLNIKHDGKTKDHSALMAIKVEPSRKIRRLSVNVHMSGERSMLPNVKPIGKATLHLRTFMFFGYVEGKWKQFQPIFNHCKFLRVLKLEDLDEMSGNLPKSVGDLVHLRFLSLARSQFKGLPQSMGNLVRLEYLNILGSRSHTMIVPNVLWKMRRLRYLYLPYQFRFSCFEIRKKLRLDTLENLRELKNFSQENCDAKDIDKLTNLQKLTVVGNKQLDIIAQLAKFNLTHLQCSFYVWSTIGELSKMSSFPYPCKMSIYGKIEKLPELGKLEQVRKLVLMWSILEEDPMPILEKLEHLVVLMLGVRAFQGKEMVCSAGGFPQLRHLLLHGLYYLEELRVAEGGMPRLARLGISDCPNLKTSLLQGVPTYDCSDDAWKERMKAVDRR